MVTQMAKYLETVGTNAKSSVYRVFPLTAAARPSAPSSPNWMRNLMAGAAIGLLAGIVLVVLRKQLDSRIRHTSEVEKLTGSGVLGVIPKAPTLQSKRRGGLGELGTTAEAFRMLRTNLRYISTERPPRSLVITSAMQGEGKSTVASNLATVLAESGEHVVLIDADLRRSAVARAFDLDGTVGLSQVLAGTATLVDALQPSHTDGLEILAAGAVPPNPSELLGSHRMEQLIEQLAQDHFVILDAPGALGPAFGAVLAIADLVLVPVGASMLDIRGAAETVGIVRRHRKAGGRGRPDILVVPSRVDRRTGSGRDVVATLAGLTEPVAPPITLKAVVVDSLSAGEAVPGDSPSGIEFAALADAVRVRLETL